MNIHTLSGMEVWQFDSLPSTNLYIKEAFRRGDALPMPLCVYADSQTQGRGRMTRSFISPEGGLYMSVLLPAKTPEEAAGKTPYAAVAVLRALFDLGVTDVRIKWVNDLYLDGKKICGILCEHVPGGVIIGIGVNIQTPRGGFPPEAGPAGAIDQDGVTRDSLLEKILLHLPAALENPADSLDAYRTHALLTGKQVICHVGDRELRGTVQGVSDDFGLILKTEEDETVTLHSGEVTRVREQKKAAFFDFDGTLRRGDSIVPYVSFVRKRGKMPFTQYAWVLCATALYLLRLQPSTLPKTAALAFRKRLTPQERSAIDSEFAAYLIQTAYRDALREWEKRRADGYQMVLLSASTENYMQYVAELLKADALLCTPVEDDGTVKNNCHGKAKVTRAEQYAWENGVDFALSCAYGDSGSDIHILTRVKDGFAVNPKRKLLKLCREKQLPVLTWK